MKSVRSKGMFLVCVCMCVVGSLVAFNRHGTMGIAAAQTTGQDPVTLQKVFGIRFTPQTPGIGAAPTLPDGRQGVAMADAISSALKAAPAGVDYQTGRVLPGVQTSAQYGTFSDDHYGRVVAPGNVQPSIQDRPVWIVTLSGPGVQIAPHGPLPAGALHNEVSEVIDAATGQYLMGYSYR